MKRTAILHSNRMCGLELRGANLLRRPLLLVSLVSPSSSSSSPPRCRPRWSSSSPTSYLLPPTSYILSPNGVPWSRWCCCWSWWSGRWWIYRQFAIGRRERGSQDRWRRVAR